MICCLCDELEVSLALARRPGTAEYLQSLTLIAERAWESEARVRVAQAMMLLQKHRAQCFHLASAS